jgi:tetratricopeptide (TPR) repeat protein
MRRKILLAALLALIGASIVAIGRFTHDHVWGLGAQIRAVRRTLDRRSFAEAGTLLQPMLQAWPDNADVHLFVAQAARRAVDPVLDAGPNAELPSSSSQPEGSTGSYEKAARELREYRRLGGTAELAHLEELLERAQRGRLGEAEPALRHLLAGDYPDAIPIYEALAKGCLLAFRLAEAEQYLSRWLTLREDPQALVWRGWVWQRLRNAPRALADYRRAVDLAPDDESARSHLAIALLEASQPREAAEQFAWLQERRPRDPTVVLGLARCELELGDAEAACRLMDDLLAAQPGNLAALTERGRLALREKRLDQAESLLRRAVAVAPFDYQPTYLLSLCLEQAGKVDEARTVRDRANRIEADVKKMAEAVRRVNVAPRDPAPRLEAGQVLMRNGFQREGLRWLESALEQNPHHRPTHQALADYYAGHGQPAAAARHRQLAAAPPGGP